MQQHDLSSQPTTENHEQIRILTVNNGEHLDGILYRLKKGFRDFTFLLKLYIFFNYISMFLSVINYNILF